MKNVLVLLILLFAVSCLPGGDAKDKKDAPREEKVGKLVLNKAELNKYRFEVNGQELTEAKIPYGCKVELKIIGAGGFKEEKGKYNCDASIAVYNSKNEEIVNIKDLYKDEYPNGLPVELFTSKVLLSLRCQTPIKINETYKFVFSLKDRASDAKLEITENFAMVPAQGLAYEEKGLKSDGAFLYNTHDADKALSESKLAAGDTLYAYFTGIGGLTEDMGTVWPDASIKFTNEFGDVLADFPDLYKEYEKTGVPLTEVQSLISMHLMLPGDLKKGKKYTAVFSVGDKKDKNKTLTARYDFVIN